MILLDRVRAQIVAIRQGAATDKAWPRFQTLIEENIDEIVETFDTRWLTSICDTYADQADPISARNAMLLSTLIKMEKIAQSYVHWRLGYTGSIAVEQDLPHQKIRLWDGMASFHLEIGDAPNTMFGRIEALVAETTVIARILVALKERLRDGDTILGALNRRHGHVFEPDFSWILGDEYEAYRASGRIPEHRYAHFAANDRTSCAGSEDAPA